MSKPPVINVLVAPSPSTRTLGAMGLESHRKEPPSRTCRLPHHALKLRQEPPSTTQTSLLPNHIYTSRQCCVETIRRVKSSSSSSSFNIIIGFSGASIRHRPQPLISIIAKLGKPPILAPSSHLALTPGQTHDDPKPQPRLLGLSTTALARLTRHR